MFIDTRQVDPDDDQNAKVGVDVDGTDDASRQVTRFRLTIWTLTGGSAIFLAWRIWTKRRRRLNLWIDDCILGVSWLCLLMSVVLLQVSADLGLGQHLEDIEDDNLATLATVSITAGTVFGFAILWSKTSFAASLLRITVNSTIRIILWFVIGSLHLSAITAIVFSWVQCVPLSKLLFDEEPGVCHRKAFVLFTFASGVYMAVIDLVLALLPWWIVQDLDVSRLVRFAISGTMSLSAIAGITAVVRVLKSPQLQEADSTFRGVEFVTWEIAECAATIIAACIPVVRCLFWNPCPVRNQSKLTGDDQLYGSEENRPNVYKGSRNARDSPTLGWEEPTVQSSAGGGSTAPDLLKPESATPAKEGKEGKPRKARKAVRFDDNDLIVSLIRRPTSGAESAYEMQVVIGQAI